MDPRKPELAVSRIKELIRQYDRIESDMSKATTSAQVASLEREGGLVVQEICLVAPRIHEAMMQASRQRRHDLSRGTVAGPTDQIIAINEATTEEAEIVEKPVEKPELPEKKPKKKTTRKKKTAKKAKKEEK